MNIAVIITGVTLVALPGWTAGLGCHLPPRDWTRLTAASLRCGLFAVRLGLAATALPTVLDAIGVHGVARVFHEALGPHTPLGALLGVVSAAALVVLEARMQRARRHSRAARQSLRVETWLGEHDDHGDHEVVVIPTAAACAYALDGLPPQIVVSQGLAENLSGDELAAVIVHERCHLRHRHQRQLELAVRTEAAFRFLPAVRRSTAVLRLTLERWADEDAARHATRAAVTGAIEKMVDVMLQRAPAPSAAPAFTAAETIRQRLEALHDEPHPASLRWRLAVVAPTAGLVLAAAATLPHTGLPFHAVLDLFGYCPL